MLMHGWLRTRSMLGVPSPSPWCAEQASEAAQQAYKLTHSDTCKPPGTVLVADSTKAHRLWCHGQD